MLRALALLILLLPQSAKAEEVRVFAAASLQGALEEIVRGFPHRVVFNFAGSRTLARQIEEGAPADLFLSADEETMDALEAKGLVVAGTRVTVLSNTLAIVVPATSALRLDGPTGLTSAQLERIAIGDPATVPAGAYARRYLQWAGVWQSVEPKVVPTSNVRAALAAVESENADAAIVYGSDAASSRKVRVAFEVPHNETPDIAYPFALVTTGEHAAAARELLALLRSPAAARVFATRGFVVAAPAGGTVPVPPSRSPELPIVLLTLRTAALSTLLIVVPGLAVAWLLARYRWRGKSLVETLVALPLVMPPVATGLLLLKVLGRAGPAGGWLHRTAGLDVVFTWRAIVMAMMVMSFPLFVRAARVAFEEVSPRLEQIARTLGARDSRVFFSVTLPLASRGIVSGMLLAFARAVGEFGATILVAGNIPGRTTTLSVAIYNMVQLGRDAEAFRLLAISVAIAFAAVWIAEAFLRRTEAKP